MADVTFKRFEDLESYKGQFIYAGKGLGLTSFGMNLIEMPPNWQDYPDHDHAPTGHEEAYMVLKGSARLTADGQSWDLVPGTMVRVGGAQRRKIVPGAKGATVLALGGTPGQVYGKPDFGRKHG